MHAAIDDAYYDEKTGGVDTEAMHLVGRMNGPNGYCKTDSRFEIERP